MNNKKNIDDYFDDNFEVTYTGDLPSIPVGQDDYDDLYDDTNYLNDYETDDYYDETDRLAPVSYTHLVVFFPPFKFCRTK